MSKVETYSTLLNQGLITPFSNDSLLNQYPNLSLVQNMVSDTGAGNEQAEDSSPPFYAAGIREKNKSRAGNKRKRINDRLEEKPKEVIHVRAKRGQATDSHSLAERVRREKINEKLKCLQELVPGCYKAMGMAVMLDVIINYVQSLQQQIEFLSMKLSAASMHFDFNNSDMDAAEILPKNSSAYEIQELERMTGEDYVGLSYFNPTWPLH